MNIVVIGCGGIGGCLLPILLKYVEMLDSENGSTSEVYLVDGDQYEPKNRSRQFFSSLTNKAEATVRRLRVDYELNLRSVPEFVTAENIGNIIPNDSVVFLCVDNHPTRKLVSDHCETLSEVALISGGNELEDGNIQVYIRKEGQNQFGTFPLTNARHPEIANPRDSGPLEMSCTERQQSEPQIIITNNLISALMLNCFYSCVLGRIAYVEVYADVISCKTRPVLSEEVPV